MRICVESPLNGTIEHSCNRRKVSQYLYIVHSAAILYKYPESEHASGQFLSAKLPSGCRNVCGTFWKFLRTPLNPCPLLLFCFLCQYLSPLENAHINNLSGIFFLQLCLTSCAYCQPLGAKACPQNAEYIARQKPQCNKLAKKDKSGS